MKYNLDEKLYYLMMSEDETIQTNNKSKQFKRFICKHGITI